MSLSKAAPAATNTRAHNPERMEQLQEVARRIASRRKFPSAFTVNGHLIRPKIVLQTALLECDGPVPAALAEAADDHACSTIRQLVVRLQQDADGFGLWPAEPPSPRQPMAVGPGAGPMTEHPASYGWSDPNAAKERQERAARVAMLREAGVPEIKGSQLLCLATIARRIRAEELLPAFVNVSGVEETVPDFLDGVRDSLPCPAPIAQGFDVIGSATTAIVAKTMLAVAKQKGLLA